MIVGLSHADRCELPGWSHRESSTLAQAHLRFIFPWFLNLGISYLFVHFFTTPNLFDYYPIIYLYNFIGLLICLTNLNWYIYMLGSTFHYNWLTEPKGCRCAGNITVYIWCSKICINEQLVIIPFRVWSVKVNDTKNIFFHY